MNIKLLRVDYFTVLTYKNRNCPSFFVQMISQFLQPLLQKINKTDQSQNGAVSKN